MATAEIVSDLCRHAFDKPCLDCYHACPLPGVAMVADPTRIGPRPRVLPEGCTGCGNCLYACPERPRAIRMLPFRTEGEG
jgi:NAD-dependent dihydropyrimidine dehydrogenase PreA subunit